MHFLKVGLTFATSTLSKLLAGLVIIKILSVYLGAEGLGRLGQFMSFMAIITIMSGGGISTGLVKYVAQFRDQAVQLRAYISAASAITLVSSGLLGMALFAAAPWLSSWLMGTPDYAHVIRVLAFIQFAVGGTNFFTGLVSGHQRVTAFAIVTSASAAAGAALVAYLCIGHGMGGAMYGLALFPALPLVMLLYWYRFALRMPWHALLPRWRPVETGKLLQFSMMLLTSALTMQLSQILIRKLIVSEANWVDVGYWQAVSKVSDAYLQFITVVLANYYLPRLAALKSAAQIGAEVKLACKIVIPLLLLVCSIIYLLRDLVIVLLFSREFLPMSSYFTWQLAGDCFKIFAYIGAYVTVAGGNTKLYIAAELIQVSLVLGLSYMFVGHYGAIGATYAHCATYVCYAILVYAVLFRFILKRRP